MNAYDAIMARRTIRKFTQQPVTQDILRKLVDAGRLAASATNAQPLKYKIVDGTRAAEVFPHLKFAAAIAPRGTPQPGEEPTAYIIALVDSEIKASADLDVGLACGNICIAAVEEGLGTCLMGAVDRDAVAKALDIPSRYTISLVIAIGYPAQKSVAVPMGDSIKYWLDDEGVLNVPKRGIEEVLV